MPNHENKPPKFLGKFSGKVIQSIEMVTRGNADYRGYLITFTDGSTLHFKGYSDAHVYVEPRYPPKSKAPTHDTQGG